MRTVQLWLEIIARIGLILIMGMSVNACSKNWEEEVMLHDGRKIMVERTQKLGGHPTLESRERVILDETITFKLPGTDHKITWTMSFRDDTSQQNGVNVFVLDIVNGTPYMAGYPAGCIAYNKWQRPNPPQILYKYVARQWKRITLSEFPAQISNANLIVGGPPAEGIKSFYTSDQVKAENHDIDTTEYRTVLREPVATASSYCDELVYYKGAWVQPGDSIGKRMMDHKGE
jgi:hypothetical protein